MPPERTPRPRQEPVSCQSCRRKKLKCDRMQPCHGCAARGLQCVYTGAGPNILPTAVPPYDALESLHAENLAIRHRLQALEDAVFESGKHSEATLPSTAYTTPTTEDEAGRTKLLPLADSVAMHSIAQELDYSQSDYQWLKGSGSVLQSLVPSKEPRISIRPLSQLNEIMSASKDIPDCISLPTRGETLTLFQHYVEKLEALQHVLFVPTVRTMIGKLYDALEDDGKVEHSHLALVLSILASITALYGLIDVRPLVLASSEKPLLLAMYWLRCSLDSLEYIWRILYPDLQTVQATILNVFLMYQTEGISSRARVLQSTAIANARSIGLHLTDSPANRHHDLSQATIIDAEVRRRVWWHLAATEWSLAVCGGPHEGTYLINPKHILVRKPRNITEEDLLSQPADFTRPSSVPTEMSYYITRIRLSELCRDAGDLAWELLTTNDAGSIAYDKVLGLDQRLVDLYQELPDFLRFDSSRQVDAQFHLEQYPQMTKQKTFIYLMIWARRCKLHLPYLLRARDDSRFNVSRTTCMASAREMLRLRQIMSSESTACNIKLPNVLHHFFIAILALVVDFCVNEDGGNEDLLKGEIHDACNILINARKRSSAAASFLDSLDQVLRKHRTRLKDRIPTLDKALKPANGVDDGGSKQQSADSTRSLTDDVPLPSAALCDSELVSLDLDNMDFEQMWQGYIEFGAHADAQSWNALVSDLEMNLE